MAKIKRLFPHWDIPTPGKVEGDSLKAAVGSAKRFSKQESGLQDILDILPFDEETQKVEMPQQLRVLLRSMLVVDPIKRPSASFVMASREFRGFEKLVGV